MEIAEAGGILRPPTPPYVVGLEVKCCYSSGRLHSTKGSPSRVDDIRKKINGFERMGVDRMAHLDVIANLPSDGVNSWSEAASRVQDSAAKMASITELSHEQKMREIGRRCHLQSHPAPQNRRAPISHALNNLPPVPTR